jgi:hypothetical protein
MNRFYLQFENRENNRKISEESHQNVCPNKIECEIETSTQESIISEANENYQVNFDHNYYPHQNQTWRFHKNKTSSYIKKLKNINIAEVNFELDKNMQCLDDMIDHLKKQKSEEESILSQKSSFKIESEKEHVTIKKRKVLKLCKFQNNKISGLTQPELYADLERLGFKCIPQNLVLCCMSDEELVSLSDFSIENKYGKIEFLSPVNLTNLDLQKTIKIVKKSIEVYPDQFFKTNLNKPPRGRKLNVCARLIYKQIKKPKNLPLDQFIMKLKKYTIKSKAMFEQYDPETQTLIILVKGF